jgi:hypothetical protein
MRVRWMMLMLVIALMLSDRALAWNDTGHMTVALIAYRRLDDAQKQKIAAILREHPHYKLYLGKTPPGVNEDEWAFLRAATWPDFVRPASSVDRTYKDASITRFHHPEWHYIDIPVVPEHSGESSSTTKPATLPMKSESNILTALDQSMKQLESAETKPQDRAVALCWVVHLIGAIHQPLHAVSLFSAAYPNGDKGGNDFAVHTESGVLRLHSYWDELLGTSDAYQAIDFLGTELSADPQCDPTRNPLYQRNTTFSSWADESHDYAAAIVYLNGRLRGAPYQKFFNHEIDEKDIPYLPPGYAGTARDLAKARITLAGYRLANVLSTVIKP